MRRKKNFDNRCWWIYRIKYSEEGVLRGLDIVGIDDFSQGSRLNVPDEIEFIEGDISFSETISNIPTDCTHIWHLAGQSSGEISFDNPIADLQKNVISTLNLIEYAEDNKVTQFFCCLLFTVKCQICRFQLKEHLALVVLWRVNPVESYKDFDKNVLIYNFQNVQRLWTWARFK